MMKILFIWMLTIILLTTGAASAESVIPDIPNLDVSMPNAGTEEVILFVLPSGYGPAFTEAQIKNDGTVIDATIELRVHDAFDVPIPNFPLEDIWLLSNDNGLLPCYGGTNPDQDTDHDGMTYWVQPPHAGGFSEDVTYVVVNGLPVSNSPLSLGFTSADINGDRVVNILDIGTFALHYFDGYTFEADFYADGVLNVLDVGRLTQGLGANCDWNP